jgi:hypothetical protein
LVVQWLIQSGIDFEKGWLLHGMFVLLNTILLTYAIVRFVGLKESKEDLLIGIRRCLHILKVRIAQSNTATVGDEV